MPRRSIHYFPPTWADREFQKSVKKCNQAERKKYEQQLSELIEDLQNAHNVLTDPIIQRWKPTSYSGIKDIKVPLIEFRGKYPLRIIARLIATKFNDVHEEHLLLIGITIDHDHDRLKRIIEHNSSEINKWSEAEPSHASSE